MIYPLNTVFLTHFKIVCQMTNLKIHFVDDVNFFNIARCL